MRWSGLRRIEGAALISRGRRSRALLPAEAISGTQFTGTSQSTFPDRALLETRIGDFASVQKHSRSSQPSTSLPPETSRAKNSPDSRRPGIAHRLTQHGA